MRRRQRARDGWRAQLPGLDVCGKTGSAQVVAHARLARGTPPSSAMQPHGWFVVLRPRGQAPDRAGGAGGARRSGGEAAAPGGARDPGAVLRRRSASAPAPRRPPRSRAIESEPDGHRPAPALQHRLGAAGRVLLLWRPSASPRSRAPPTASRFAGLYLKQLYAVGLGLAGAAWSSVTLDYRRLADRAPLLYAGAVAALVDVLLLRPAHRGHAALVPAGPWVQVQPSELAKIVAALLVAKVFSESRKESLGLARHRSARAPRSGVLVAADRRRARPGHGLLPGAAVPDRRVPGRACACGPCCGLSWSWRSWAASAGSTP